MAPIGDNSTLYIRIRVNISPSFSDVVHLVWEGLCAEALFSSGQVTMTGDRRL
jgi:hypothetical protein